MTQDTREPRLGALSRTRRRTLYGISVGVWVTGAVWLVYHYFIRSVDQFGFENAHPHQQWWLIAHAAFGCWALWMFGVLWPGHVKAGWRMKSRRLSGGTLFGVVAWLTLTGLALYYIGSTQWRSWTSIAHWAVGLAAAAAFLLHLPTRKTAARIEAERAG
jgi:hypothetical protein